MSAAMSAAVETTAGPAVKAGATAVSTSTMEVAATITTAAVEVPTAIASSIEAASVTAVTVGAVSATAVIAAAIAVSATVVATPVIAVPGAGTDEDAANEPVRAVVSVGSTVVGGIIVVAIGADWRGTVIDRSSYANAEGDALGVGVGGREKTNTETNCE